MDEATSPLNQSSRSEKSTSEKWESSSVVNFVHAHAPPPPVELEEEEEKELVPIPIQRDPIPPMPMVRPNASKKLLSRTEKARLLTAGFEPVVDIHGHMINSFGLNPIDREKIIIDPELERKDKLMLNHVSILFMGITMKQEAQYCKRAVRVIMEFEY